MNLSISKKMLKSAHLTEKEIKQEIALALFKKEKLTLAQASKLALMDRLQFQHLLSSRKIQLHYSQRDFENDLKVIKSLNK